MRACFAVIYQRPSRYSPVHAGRTSAERPKTFLERVRSENSKGSVYLLIGGGNRVLCEEAGVHGTDR